MDVLAALLRLGSLNVLDRLGVLADREGDVGVLPRLVGVLERIVVCPPLAELVVLRDPAAAGLRTTVVLVDRLVLDALRETVGDVRGREIVVRLGVLLLDRLLLVTDLDRLGVELRVDALGALLRLETLGADRLGLLDRELERAAARLLLLLPELPLFRELLAPKTGSMATARIKRHKAKTKEGIPARRDSTVLIFDI